MRDRSISFNISPRSQSRSCARVQWLISFFPNLVSSSKNDRLSVSLSLSLYVCKSLVVPINSPYSHSTTRRAARDCRSSVAVARRLVLSCACRTSTFTPFLSTPVVEDSDIYFPPLYPSRQPDARICSADFDGRAKFRIAN